MNITEVKKVLPVLFKHKIVPFLWGTQGIGKTQVIKQIAKEAGFDGCIVLNLATQEVGDLIGLLEKTEDGSVVHLRPKWFPTEGKYLIFMDEFNRALPDVHQAMFPFILEGKLHTHQLPPGCAMVVAGNYNDNRFNVTDTSDAALVSRFCHIDFLPTKEEFIMYAENQGHESVADFIRTYPEMLEIAPKQRLDLSMVTPDRRSWCEFIAPLEREEAIENERYEVYSGLIGQSAAASFITWKTKQSSRLSGRKILSNYKEVRKAVKDIVKNDKEMRFDVLNSAAEEIFLMLEDKTKPLPNTAVSNLQDFILDVPLELGNKIVTRIRTLNWKDKNKIVNDTEFVKRFKTLKLTDKK